MKVTLPIGQFISPGTHQVHTVRTEVKQTWFMGVLIEHEELEINEVHQVLVPDPGMDGPEDDDNSWPLRGSFTFADKTWTVVRDDDIGFWGFHNGHPLTKAEATARWDHQHRVFMQQGVAMGWWELDSTGTVPLRLPIKVSIAAMAADNKTLMAHLMVDLELFPSVGQAKKNGWDKPLELGRHELGPKKKRVSVEIIP